MADNTSDYLKSNYCFWCTAYGETQADFCYNCGYEIGSCPPEIDALIAHKVNEAKIQGGIDEMTRVDPNAYYYPTGREPIGSQERLTELKDKLKTDTTEKEL